MDEEWGINDPVVGEDDSETWGENDPVVEDTQEDWGANDPVIGEAEEDAPTAPSILEQYDEAAKGYKERSTALQSAMEGYQALAESPERTPEQEAEMTNQWQSLIRSQAQLSKDASKLRELQPAYDQYFADQKQARIDYIEDRRGSGVFGDDGANALYELDARAEQEYEAARSIEDDQKRKEAVAAIQAKYQTEEKTLNNQFIERFKESETKINNAADVIGQAFAKGQTVDQFLFETGADAEEFNELRDSMLNMDDPEKGKLYREAKAMYDLAVGQKVEDGETVPARVGIVNNEIRVSPLHVWDVEGIRAEIEALDISDAKKQKTIASIPQLQEEAAKVELPFLQQINQFNNFVKENNLENVSPKRQIAEWKSREEGWLSYVGKAFPQIGLGLTTGTLGLLEAGQAIVGATALTMGAQDFADPFLDAATKTSDEIERLTRISQEIGGPTLAAELAAVVPQIVTQIGFGGAVAFGGRKVGLKPKTVSNIGFGSSVGVAFAQSYGGVLSSAFQQLEKEKIDGGMDPVRARAEAIKEAQLPAALSGLSTAVVTTLGGKRGAEAVFRQGADGIKAKLNTAAFRAELDEFIPNVVKGFRNEGYEEFADQLAQGIIEQFSFNPELSTSDIVNNAFKALVIGGITGGTVEGLKYGYDYMRAPSQMARREESMASMRQSISDVEKEISEAAASSPIGVEFQREYDVTQPSDEAANLGARSVDRTRMTALQEERKQLTELLEDQTISRVARNQLEAKLAAADFEYYSEILAPSRINVINEQIVDQLDAMVVTQQTKDAVTALAKIANGLGAESLTGRERVAVGITSIGEGRFLPSRKNPMIEVPEQGVAKVTEAGRLMAENIGMVPLVRMIGLSETTQAKRAEMQRMAEQVAAQKAQTEAKEAAESDEAKRYGPESAEALKRQAEAQPPAGDKDAQARMAQLLKEQEEAQRKAMEALQKKAAPAEPPVEEPPAIPELEPLRRVARAEQTPEDVKALSDAGLVEIYKDQPVITEAGIAALPEAERPRLSPEARKIQIDTGANAVVAEAISKNLRIGVDQVGPNVKMPEGWTLDGDIYVPPQKQEVVKTEEPPVTPPAEPPIDESVTIFNYAEKVKPIEDQIDARIDELMKGGMAFGEANQDPSVRALFEQRYAMDRGAINNYRNIVNKAFADQRVTEDNLVYNPAFSIIEEIYAVPQEGGMIALVSERGQEAFDDDAATIKKLSEAIFKYRAEAEGLDPEGLLGPMSALTDAGKKARVDEARTAAEAIHNQIKSSLLEQPTAPPTTLTLPPTTPPVAPPPTAPPAGALTEEQANQVIKDAQEARDKGKPVDVKGSTQYGPRSIEPKQVIGKTAREALLAVSRLNLSKIAQSDPNEIMMQDVAAILAELNMPILDAEQVVTLSSIRRRGRARRRADVGIAMPTTFNTPVELFVHEIGHTLTADEIAKYAPRNITGRGKAYLEAINKVIADANTPDPVKRLFTLYVSTMDQLGITEQYFGDKGIAGTPDADSSRAMARRLQAKGDLRKDLNWVQLYGLANIEEFVSQTFSEPDFRDLLKTLKDPTQPSRTLWSAFVEAIQRILQLPRESMAAGVIEASVDIGMITAPSRAAGRAAPTPAPRGEAVVPDIWQAPEQEITSARTSINERKLPAVFNKVKEWVSGTINADIGGGRFDNATNWLQERGVTNLIIDWFNRDRAFNEANIERVRGGQADTATVSNVLNVIQEQGARDLVIRQAADAIKEDGTAYFYIYEGDQSGTGKQTTSGWQENRRTQDYIEEISVYFGDVTRQGQMIVAKSPIKEEGDMAPEGEPEIAEATQKHLDAVANNNIEEAQRLTDEVAQTRNYNSENLLFHGTTHIFNVFSKDRANIENDFGKGYYLTNTEDDAQINYAGEGPDLTNRIERLAEQLQDNENMDEDAAKEKAREILSGGGQRIMRVYVKLENPFNVGGPNETFLDYNLPYDETTEEYGEPTGTLAEFVEQLRAIIERYSEDSAVDADKAVGNIVEYAMDRDGISASDLVRLLKQEDSGIMWAADENGDSATSEIIREAIEATGFDGIVDSLVNQKFGSQKRIGAAMRGMGPDTVHTIVFNSSQIKSADAVTRDDQGNVIPLSQRFIAEEEDVRFAPEEEFEIIPEQVEDQIEGTPEASTIKVMGEAFNMADEQSNAEGTPEGTLPLQTITNAWMNSGRDVNTLKNAIIRYTNLSPEVAATLAQAISKQLEIQRGIAEVSNMASRKKEREPEYRPFSFGKRIADELPAYMRNKMDKAYEVLRNDVSIEEANRVMQSMTVEEAMLATMKMDNGVPMAVRSMMAQITLRKIMDKRMSTKGKRRDEYRATVAAHVEFLDWINQYLMEMGQGVQAFSKFSDLGADGILLKVRKDIGKAIDKHITNRRKDIDKIKRDVEDGDSAAFDATLKANKSNIEKAADNAAKGEAKKLTIEEQAQKLAQRAAQRVAGQTVRRQTNPLSELVNGHLRKYNANFIAEAQALGVSPETAQKIEESAIKLRDARVATKSEKERFKAMQEERMKVKRELARENKYIYGYRPTIWEDYQSVFSERLARRLMRDPKKKIPPSLLLFTDRLTENLLGFVPEAERQASTPKSFQAMIEDALNNKERYQEAFNRALEDISLKIGELEVRMETGEKLGDQYKKALAAQEFLERLAPQIQDFPVSDKLIMRFVGQKTKAANVSIVAKYNEWYRASRTQRKKLEQELAESLVSDVNISNADAVKLARYIVKDFVAKAEERREKALARFKKPKEKSKRLVESPLKKFFELVNMGAMTDQEAYEVMAHRFELPTWDEKFAETIEKMALELQDMPEGNARRKMTQNLMAEIARRKGFSLADLGAGFAYSNMLSDFETFLINLNDTLINNFTNAFANSVGDGDWSRMKGLVQGYRKGWREAVYTFNTGLRINMPRLEEKTPLAVELVRYGRKGGVPLENTEGMNALAKTILESYPARVLNAWRYITRIMEATDAFNYTASAEGQRYAEAAKMAKDEGLKGKAKDKRINEILNLGDDKYQAALKQAEQEGYTGADAKLRAIEIQDSAIEPEMRERSFERALTDVYRNMPKGTAGMFAGEFHKHIMKWKNPWVRNVLKLITAPFVITPTNLFNKWLDWSPYGYKRLFWGSGNFLDKDGPYYLAPPKVGSSDFYAQAFKASSSVLVMGLVGGLIKAGLLELIGRGPSDEEERKQWLDDGNKPYTFRFMNGPAISFAYTPWALMLSAMANISNWEKYNKKEDSTLADRSYLAFLETVGVVMELPFFSGPADLIEALIVKSNQSLYSASSRFVESKYAMLFPNLVRKIDNIFDPTIYDSQGIKGLILDKVPFARRFGNQRLNMFGEPIGEGKPVLDRFIGRTIVTEKPSRESRILAKYDAYPYMPNPRQAKALVDGEKAQMTEEQYNEFARGAGQEFKKWLNSNYDPDAEVDERSLERGKERIHKRLSEIRARWVRKVSTY